MPVMDMPPMVVMQRIGAGGDRGLFHISPSDPGALLLFTRTNVRCLGRVHLGGVGAQAGAERGQRRNLQKNRPSAALGAGA